MVVVLLSAVGAEVINLIEGMSAVKATVGFPAYLHGKKQLIVSGKIRFFF